MYRTTRIAFRPRNRYATTQSDASLYSHNIVLSVSLRVSHAHNENSHNKLIPRLRTKSSPYTSRMCLFSPPRLIVHLYRAERECRTVVLVYLYTFKEGEREKGRADGRDRVLTAVYDPRARRCFSYKSSHHSTPRRHRWLSRRRKLLFPHLEYPMGIYY